MSKMPASKRDRSLNRGARSGLFLALYCVLGVIIATWFTFEINPIGDFSVSSKDNTTQIAINEAGYDDTVFAFNPTKILPNESGLQKRTGVLKRHSNPLKVLRTLGAGGQDAYLALDELYKSELVNPRRLIAGLTIDAYFDLADDTLQAVAFQSSENARVISKRQSNGSFFAAKLAVSLQKKHVLASHSIRDSFYQTAIGHGLKDKQISDFAQIFAFDVDFQREIRNGDKFEILYEVYTDENNNYCLLYTSPSPRDRTRSRMPSSA